MSDFEVRIVQDKGRGLFTNKKIAKGEIVLEYVGELITEKEAERREEIYGDGDHCYMFYFSTRAKNDQKITMCIDATNCTHISRYINHSRKFCNLIPILKNGNSIFFKAKFDIDAGTELLFDYGERRKNVLAENPWLRE